MRWINEEKRRYYQAHLVRDLLGDLLLVAAWGSLDSKRGNMRSTLVESHADGLVKLQALDKRRRQRGYLLVDEAVPAVLVPVQGDSHAVTTSPADHRPHATRR
jgi:hypothetical protein